MTVAWHPELRREAQLAAGLLARQESIEPEVAIAVACRHFGVSRLELVAHRRSDQRALWARAFVVWCLRSFGDSMSYPAIGDQIGRTHSAAINLHMVAIRLRLSQPAFAAVCRGLIDHSLYNHGGVHACH